MDAVEYLKTLRRLCKSKGRCSECKLYNKEEGFCIADRGRGEYAEDAVQIVEQWAKANPIKTRQSERRSRMHRKVDVCSIFVRKILI